MADEHKRYTIPRGAPSSLHSAMNRIQDKGEDAIVHDENQSYWGDGAQHSDAKGDYYDVYAGGELIDTTDNAVDAVRSLQEHQRQHPKQ